MGGVHRLSRIVRPRNSFDRVAQSYEDRAQARTCSLSSFLFSRRNEVVLDLLDATGTRGTVLDFGMGPGVLARAVVARGHRFIGVDLSEAMVARARALGVENATYVRGDLDALDAYRGQVDVVMAIGLIDYLEEPQRGLRQLVECLRPGGTLIVSFRNRRALVTRTRDLAKRL